MNDLFHPLANLFPLIEGDEFKAFTADLKVNSIRDPIDILDGKILDGRNRYRGGIKAGILKPGVLRGKHFRKFDPKVDGDPLTYVLSKNLARRHLNESQRAMVASRIATMRQGGTHPSNVDQKKLTQHAASRVMTVSERSVRDARVVQEKGSAELVRAVDSGKMAVSLAAQASRLDPAQQKLVVAEVNAGRANAVRTVVKREARAAKEKALSVKQKAFPDKRYGVILADPEWRFEPRNRETGMDRAADQHYPTSGTDAIAARGVETIAAKDCVLFLWATAPMLPDALRVMAAWGFTYKTHAVWRKAEKYIAKPVLGTGYWFRSGHEILLLGTRGNMPAPAMGSQQPSIIDAPPLKHSEKPDAFYELIESYFPNLPKIELNARKARKGWDAWGNEAPGVSRET